MKPEIFHEMGILMKRGPTKRNIIRETSISIFIGPTFLASAHLIMAPSISSPTKAHANENVAPNY